MRALYLAPAEQLRLHRDFAHCILHPEFGKAELPWQLQFAAIGAMPREPIAAPG
jgi:hypothetical protein